MHQERFGPSLNHGRRSFAIAAKPHDLGDYGFLRADVPPVRDQFMLGPVKPERKGINLALAEFLLVKSFLRWRTGYEPKAN